MGVHVEAAAASTAGRRAVATRPGWNARRGMLAFAAYCLYLWVRRKREGPGGPHRPPSQGNQVRRAPREDSDAGARWEDALPTPKLQWEQLLTWRVLRFALQAPAHPAACRAFPLRLTPPARPPRQWIVRRAAQRLAAALGQRPPDWSRLAHEVDLEAAFRKKRWGAADPAAMRCAPRRAPSC